MHKTVLYLIITLLIFTSSGVADEGYWPLRSIKNLPLEKAGIHLPHTAIFDPGNPSISDTIVNINHGTGAFVSAEGLILTNHHVAAAAAFRSSDEETNMLKAGFLARSRDEEIPAKEYTATVTVDCVDITAELEEAMALAKTAQEQGQAMQTVARAAIDRLPRYPDEPAKHVYRYSLAHKGDIWYLLRLIDIRDIRIVYIPPDNIGNFGGDIDNFLWPRHQGDFSFLRAYVDAEGKPADYSPGNVPFRPSRFLNISLGGVQENSPVFAIGYPDETDRYAPGAKIRFKLLHEHMPQRKNLLHNLAVHGRYRKESEEADEKLAYADDRLENLLKYTSGLIDGIRQENVIATRENEERMLLKSTAISPEQKTRLEEVLASLQAVYGSFEGEQARMHCLGNLLSSSSLFNLAREIYMFASEPLKNEDERDPAYDADMVDWVRGFFTNKYYSLYVPAERELLADALEQLLNNSDAKRVAVLSRLIGGDEGTITRKDIDGYVARLFAGTSLVDREKGINLIGTDLDSLNALNDPLINLAITLEPDFDWWTSRSNELKAQTAPLLGEYHHLMKALKGQAYYPDCDDTVRFTYGRAGGYEPRDGVVYTMFTTLAGAVAKDTGVEPFDVPDKLKALQADSDFGRYASPTLDGEVPLAFLSDLDISGGNSGSPVMNDRGEIVGIIFDKVYEALYADYIYNPAKNRVMAVDIRYVLFVTEKFAGAQHIIDELTIVE